MPFNLDPDTARKNALALAVVGCLFGALAGGYATSGELSGHTVAIKSAYRSFKTLPVSKADSPEKFRDANNFLWFISFVGFGMGALGFYFYRDLKD